MRASGPSFLAAIGLPRLSVIVISGILAGLVVGYALATLSEDDKPASSVVVQPPASSGSSNGEGSGSASEETPLRAVLLPAATESGKQRRRARVEVTVRLFNDTDRERPATAEPALLSGDRRVHVDPSATAEAGGLLKALPAGASASGVLRFETAGAMTDGLIERRRAQLRIAGKTHAVRITIGEPPAP